MSPKRADIPEACVVEWPGGPYDFELEPYGAPEPAEHRPGWFYVTGVVVKPEGVATTGMVRTLCAEKVGPDRFRMIPKQPWTTVNPAAFRPPPKLPWD
jgi:hypothetical protein